MNTTSPRRIVVTATATAIALSSILAAAAPAQAAEQTLSDIDNSLVHVYTEYSGYIYYPTDDGWIWSEQVTAAGTCTGWFASDDGYIATAGHCVQPDMGREMLLRSFLADWDAEELLPDALAGWVVEGSDQGSDVERTVEVVQPDGADDPVIDSWTTAQVVDFQDFEDGDAALLKVAGVTDVQPLQVSATSPEVGDEIVSIGFPGSVQDVVDVQRLGASYKTGTVSSRQVTDGGVPVTEVNAQVSAGMSGGPTIDDAGDVIGINSFGINGESQSFNFVTDTEGLAQFLTSHGVEFTAASADRGEDTATGSTPTGESEKGEGSAVLSTSGRTASDSGAFIGLAVGGAAAIVVIGGIGALIILLAVRRNGRRQAAGVVTTQAPFTGAPAPTQPPSAAPAPVATGFAAPLSTAPAAPTQMTPPPPYMG